MELCDFRICYRGLFDEALNLLDQIKEEALKPDLVTYNILVSGYSTLGCVMEALAMIHQMKISGLTPNVVSWTALISGCTQNGYYRMHSSIPLRRRR